MLAEGHPFPNLAAGERSSLPIIGVERSNGDLECRRHRLSSSDLARSARPAARRLGRTGARSDRPRARRRPSAPRAASRAARRRPGPGPLAGHAQQPDPPALPGERTVQLGDGVVQIRADVRRVGKRPGAGERREVRQAGLQDDRAGAVAVLAQPRRHPSRERRAAPAGCPRRRPGPARTSPRGSPTSAPRTAPRRGRRRRSPARGGDVPTHRPSRRSRMDSGVRPRSPIVRIPSRPRVSPVFSPTPHRRPTGSGSRNAWTPSAGTTSIPSGLQSSDASFATNFVGATPTEHVTPTSRSTSARIFAAISAGTRTASWRPRRPGTPRRARSAPRAGCRSSRTSRNRLEWARYASKSDGRKTMSGHRRRARTAGIAERTPYFRAS